MMSSFPETQTPLVSLLVAVRNEAKYIKDCLKSLITQDYPANQLEIFIIDGNSTDDTRAIVEGIIIDHPNVHLLTNPERIQAIAWNIGIRACQGEIIGIVSGHIELASDYVSQAVAALKRTGVEMVGGPVQAKSSGILGDTIAIAMSNPFGVGGAIFRYAQEETETDTVFMGLMHRSVYHRVGLFDEEMVRNQDDELSYRLLKYGGKIICTPKIQSSYYSRTSLSSLFRQYFQYGYWKVRVLQKHPLQMRLRQFVPLILVSALLFPVPFVFFFPQTLPFYLLIPATYLIANLGASLRTASQRGWQYLAYLPIVYAILHLSYGTGFLIGLIKFANRWGDKKGQVPDFRPVES